jgi:HPt (histidine-containing phosphotransfer) domain-containing protein
MPKPLRRADLKAVIDRVRRRTTDIARSGDRILLTRTGLGGEPRAGVRAPDESAAGTAAAPPALRTAVASPPGSPSAAAPPTRPQGDSPLDRRTIESLRDLERQGSSNLVKRIVRLYLDSVPALLEELRLAIQSGDPDRMGKAAHSLKSGSGNVGALHLLELCKEVETLGRSGTIGAAGARREEILDEFERVKQALEAEAEVTVP